MSRVLLVGKGPPDRGGIAALLETLTGSELNGRHELVLLNLTRDAVPKRRKLSTTNLRRAVEDAWAVFRASRDCEVVHIHAAVGRSSVTLRAGLLAFAARCRGARVLLHAHSGAVADRLSRSALARRATRLALRWADCIITVSASGQRALAQCTDPERVLQVSNGVDVDAYTGQLTEHTPPRVLYAGLLTPRKGVIDLLEASALLHERGVRHELILAGGTPTEGVEAEAAVRAAARPDVRFLGAVPHERMPEIYRDAAVFCLPSWWEGMPMSVLEAMAAGLPVVATDVGSIPTVVDHEVTGLLVPLRDPSALADALQRLLENPALRQRMGTAGREVATARYHVRTMIDVLDELYRGAGVPA